MYYENLKKLCESKGGKPADVSKATGIATATLSNWKNGNYVPKQEKLQLVADYFNVSLDYLLTGEEREIVVESAKKDAKLINLSSRIKEYALKLAELPKEKQDQIISLIDMLEDKKQRRNKYEKTTSTIISCVRCHTIWMSVLTANNHNNINHS